MTTMATMQITDNTTRKMLPVLYLAGAPLLGSLARATLRSIAVGQLAPGVEQRSFIVVVVVVVEEMSKCLL